MQNTFSHVFLAALLLALPEALSAQTVPQGESCEKVESLLASGSSAGEVIAALVDGGRILTEATVFSMVCGGQDKRIDMVTAGVGLAASLPEAESVVTAVVAAAGEGSPEAVAARGALESYAKTAPQPPVYRGEGAPTGGSGVSPFEPTRGGGQNPFIPTRGEIVSPSS